MSEIIKALNWRYATQQYDSSKKVSEEDFDELLEVMRLAPSSFGLQPWKFIVVKDAKLREDIQKAAYGQPKVTDSSHLVVLAAKVDMSPEYIDEYVNLIANIRKLDTGSKDKLRNMILGATKNKSPEQLKAWNQKQLYISLGMVLEAAALKGIDAGPMEGFNSKEVDKILGLEKDGFSSIVLLALGYRSSSDKAAHYKKVRFPKNKVIEVR